MRCMLLLNDQYLLSSTRALTLCHAATFAGVFVYAADQPITDAQLKAIDIWFGVRDVLKPLLLVRNKCDLPHADHEQNVQRVISYARAAAKRHGHLVRSPYVSLS